MNINWFNTFFSKQDISDDTNKIGETTNQINIEQRDGAIEIENSVNSFNLPFEVSYNTQADLLNKYREISSYHEVDYAIEDIVNEMVSFQEDQNPIELNLDDIDKSLLSDKIKEIVYQKWDKINKILDLTSTIHNRARQFYTDGRLSWHKIIDKNDLKGGLKDIIEFDPIYVTKVREIKTNREDGTIEGYDEYFVYNENIAAAGTAPAQESSYAKNKSISTVEKPKYKLNKDSVTYITSGMTDASTGYAISWLHKALRPANQLRMMENSLVIYRIVRAPERRMFYIDVSGMQNSKATQYIRNLKNSYRNRMSYDPENGTFKDSRYLQTMQEDFWLPKNSKGSGTEISTLPGGQNLSEIDDVTYFLKRLYKALNVPISRLESDSMVNFGNQSEISRDELKFSKFVSRIRKRFNEALLDVLQTELILTKTISREEWDNVKPFIKFKYAQDFYLEEQKQNDLLQSRLELLDKLSPYIGKYFSHQYVRSEILAQTGEDIAEQDKLIAQEAKNNKYNNADEENGDSSSFDAQVAQNEPSEPASQDDPNQ